MMSDEKFFSSLRDDVPELMRCTELFSLGDTASAKKEFFEYVKSRIDRTTYFDAIDYYLKDKPSDDTIKEADDALDLNMVSCSVYYRFDGEVDWYSNHTYNGYEEWTWQLSRHAQLVSLARVYAYTGDERYAESAVSLLKSWMLQAVVPPIETDGHDTLCWRTIECGIRMRSWPKIIFPILDSPAVDTDFIVDVFKSLYEHGERLYKQNTAANWLIIEMFGLFALAKTFPVFKESELWSEFAKSIYIREMNDQILPDGSHYELTFGYQRVSLNGFSDVLKLCRAFGDDFPTEYVEKLRNSLHYMISMMRPDGGCPSVNDGWLHSVASELSRAWSIFPEDELIRWVTAGRPIDSAPDFKTFVARNAGLVFFRSGWEKDAVAGFFDGGKFGRCHNHENIIRCHQHEDKLNFLLYFGDKNLIAESQPYAYDTSDMRYHVLSSAGHNVAMVNGEGQNRFLHNCWNDAIASSIEDLKFESVEAFEMAEATYSEGYGPNADRCATHTRAVYFIKSPEVGLPYFIIKDTLKADRESNFDLIWHFNTESPVVAENSVHSDDITAFFAGDKGDISVLCGSKEPFAGWISHSFTQGDVSAIPTVYYKLRGTECCAVTVFAPHINGECCIESADYTNGVIKIRYKNGGTLTIDK